MVDKCPEMVIVDQRKALVDATDLIGAVYLVCQPLGQQTALGYQVQVNK